MKEVWIGFMEWVPLIAILIVVCWVIGLIFKELLLSQKNGWEPMQLCVRITTGGWYMIPVQSVADGQLLLNAFSACHVSKAYVLEGDVTVATASKQLVLEEV